jgi:hypothetical protein
VLNAVSSDRKLSMRPEKTRRCCRHDDILVVFCTSNGTDADADIK